MRKSRLLILILILATLLSSCGQGGQFSNDGVLNIVCTTFPQYDWLKNLTVGVDNVEITLLVDQGVDLHSYQPTADDVIKIASADLFVYGGGASDGWVADAVKEAVNKDIVVVDMMALLGDKVKTVAHDHEGDADHDHESDADHDHEGDADHANESDADHTHEDDADHDHKDEHVWLSLKNAELIVGELTHKLVELDPDNVHLYGQNSAHYLAELQQLDQRYQQVVADAKHDTLIFADRFPFIYLVEDYGLNYYAAFSGCSAETEASFETVVFLASKLDEHNLKTVLVLEKNDGKIAQTIIENSTLKDAEIAVLNSMQSITSADQKNGADYLSIMQENLTVLEKALN